ncbi:hypothetical protein B0T26DRAFT_693362 [Lasiosphaeria miniovina]|uniref:GST N-terminal domain-containing protein n=1 Tax=Lasiosphaeria miniovina TaxID=1954250 RepID=A0AA40B466_9PEZI|nr:uncharacterized protein B0T26DRAFT_693362 [Lasiosphaeria miniovina]KAK0727178.1 hypothetical protein B0T26DRAFT_693362 [Lasiosphaeria miniovina]
MAYRLHITNKNYSSWSLRPWLLMRVLEIPFDEVLHALEETGSFRQPQWSAFSPVARVPCLHVSHDTSKEPLVLWDSLAIVEYLAEAHSTESNKKNIYPPAPAARAWARSATAEMHAGFAALRDELGMNVGLRIALSGPDSASDALRADLRRVGELWTDGLARFGGPFLAGPQFSAVDAFYAPVVLRLQTYLGSAELLGGDRERIDGYVRVVMQLEEVRVWVDDAIKETARDLPHDEDSIARPGRRLVSDLRAVV